MESNILAESLQSEVVPTKVEEEKLVYSQDEYAKKDFWNDRFKE